MAQREEGSIPPPANAPSSAAGGPTVGEILRLLQDRFGDEYQESYEDGKREFCDAIVASGGTEALHHVFSGPDALPTVQELENPKAWLERTAAPVAGS